MSGIRKVSRPFRRPNSRSRLQRALSLSSKSDDTRSPSSSSTGDKTEDESHSQGVNHAGDQENSTSDDGSEQEAARQRRTVFGHETDLEIRGKTQLSGDSNMVALEYPTEYIKRSLHDQVTWIETGRKDLADIFGRLAIVETEVQKVIREGTNKSIEGQKTIPASAAVFDPKCILISDHVHQSKA
ncbi:unnamed protein product [Penicillium nalgiovense]|nr:unnamed protein product [Penicillium nalgiovense]